MHRDSAALSSVASAIDDLAKRVAEVAERLQGEQREGVAAELFEAERALTSASRRLVRAQRDLG
ncbi:MAG: hypothetical protein ACRD0U_11615 [Acidimicrobiales bacterium]